MGSISTCFFCFLFLNLCLFLSFLNRDFQPLVSRDSSAVVRGRGGEVAVVAWKSFSKELICSASLGTKGLISVTLDLGYILETPGEL